jgi:hypothetical protein
MALFNVSIGGVWLPHVRTKIHDNTGAVNASDR